MFTTLFYKLFMIVISLEISSEQHVEGYATAGYLFRVGMCSQITTYNGKI